MSVSIAGVSTRVKHVVINGNIIIEGIQRLGYLAFTVYQRKGRQNKRELENRIP